MNKKAITNEFIIGLIIVTVSFLVSLFYIYDYYKDLGYQTSLFECNQFVKTIEGKPVYYGTSLDTPQKTLLNVLSSTCDAKQFDLEKNKISEATELVNDCWFKMANGKDILPANMQGNGLCVYCGSIKANEDISEFKKDFQEELKKEKYEELFQDRSFINLNKNSLENVPDSLNQDAELSVFYYIYKPSDDWDFQTSLSKYVGDWGGFFELINYKISSSDLNTYGGVIISDSEEILSLKSSSKDNINDKDKFEGSCTFIIPDKIHGLD